MDNQQFSEYKIVGSGKIESASLPANYMATVFLWMFAALGISAVFAGIFAANADLMSYFTVINGETGRRSFNTLGLAVAFAPIGFVLLMSFGFRRLSATALTLLFMAYAVVNGISFSVILLQFTARSVAGCFGSAALMFGIMAVAGYTTKKDLTSFGRILTMGLIGILVAIVINIFLRSSGLDYMISLIGVIVFTGLTAYDVQKLKAIGAEVNNGNISVQDGRKLSIIGALNLYLDFINIFLLLLRLFGGRRN